MRQAAEDLEAEELPNKSVGKRGRPPQPASRERVAEVTGIKPQDQVRVEQHVDLAEQYPVFKRPEWRCVAPSTAAIIALTSH